MFAMISGETVSVQLRSFGATDAYGNEIEVYSEPQDVGNVLCGRGGSVDLERDGQPYAIKADRRFCFPRGYSADLRGALITREGVTYQVVGIPFDSTEENLPGLPWNMRVEAVFYNG